MVVLMYACPDVQEQRMYAKSVCIVSTVYVYAVCLHQVVSKIYAYARYSYTSPYRRYQSLRPGSGGVQNAFRPRTSPGSTRLASCFTHVLYQTLSHNRYLSYIVAYLA